MNLCSESHDEVCYGGSFLDCPACAAIREKNNVIEARDDTIAELRTENEKLENRIETLEEDHA